jgi:hypothetical protein
MDSAVLSLRQSHHRLRGCEKLAHCIEGLYCKRPIKCLASSEYRAVSGVFRNIDPPPPHRPTSEYPLPMVRGRTHSVGGERVRVSIFRKTPDTALYNLYVSTLWIAAKEIPIPPTPLTSPRQTSSSSGNRKKSWRHLEALRRKVETLCPFAGQSGA